LAFAVTRQGLPAKPLGRHRADLISSCGCQHHCTDRYVAGASALASEEAHRAGASRPSARAVERSLEDIADEIAGLFHVHGAHVYNFMDDNLLLSMPPQVEAWAWARALARALRARSVPEVALTMQFRADAVDSASARALAELGLVRAYVGIDGYSPSQLAQLGLRAGSGQRAVTELSACGISATSVL
jgi:hypothetical protein